MDACSAVFTEQENNVNTKYSKTVLKAHETQCQHVDYN